MDVDAVIMAVAAPKLMPLYFWLMLLLHGVPHMLIVILMAILMLMLN
jgi:hypothetical protein